MEMLFYCGRDIKILAIFVGCIEENNNIKAADKKVHEF